jgi:hypothetical protein
MRSPLQWVCSPRYYLEAPNRREDEREVSANLPDRTSSYAMGTHISPPIECREETHLRIAHP